MKAGEKMTRHPLKTSVGAKKDLHPNIRIIGVND